MPPEAKPKTFEDWIVLQSADVQAIAKAFPPDSCCKLKDDALGHFLINAYSQNRETGEITVVLIQGKDSRLPGAMTEGIPLDRLDTCGCGEWEPPTDEQGDLMRKHIEFLHKAQEIGGYAERARQLNESRRRQPPH